MKFKFNLKLTLFLVSLFVSLILVILGSKNNYCLSFGFIIMGASLFLFVWYSNENITKSLEEVEQQLDEVDANEELDEEEQAYILKQLYLRQRNLEKKKKQFAVTFYLGGAVFIILGFVGLF